MTVFRHPPDFDALLHGVDHLLILCTPPALQQGWAQRALPPGLRDEVQLLAQGLEAGPSGKLRESWRHGTPKRIVVGALPTKLSRHNSPTRRDAITELVGQAKLEGTAGIIIVLDEPAHLVGAAAGVASAFPRFDRRKSSGLPQEIHLLASSQDGRSWPASAEQQRALEVVRDTARLVDLPAEDLTPDAFAAEVGRSIEDLKGVQLKIHVGPELLALGLRAHHAVGRAATTAPRLVVLDTGPRGSKKTVALVGKGVTFDTGGLHIKARGPMDTMKCDMGGAAAVLGAFRLLARERLDRRVIALLALAENAIGPSAFRPGDILEAHSGKTIEINNTDAEGRLLLADALSFAARQLGAEILANAATLTGAQMIATGIRHAGVVSNREDLEQLAIQAGKETGELVHPLPFAPEFYQREFRSKVADMKNSVGDRSNAQASCAAQFVWSHIEDTGLPWLHVDLAGPAFREERGTGYGALLLTRWVGLLPE